LTYFGRKRKKILVLWMNLWTNFRREKRTKRKSKVSYKMTSKNWLRTNCNIMETIEAKKFVR
jgi:hypothetical protein